MIKSRDMDLEISNVLVQLGIHGNVVGAKFLTRAIEIAINNPNALTMTTKMIYSLIALEEGTSTANVERGIRRAIDIAVAKNRLVRLNDIFGVQIYSAGDKPCNSEIISLLSVRIPFMLMRKRQGYREQRVG